MRSMEAGTSSTGVAVRVAVTTTASSCASAGAAASSSANPPPLMAVRLQPMSKFLLALLLWITLPASAQSPDWLAEVRAGGHVLYFRHAATDFSQNDAAMKSFQDCASQRNLTDKGRDEARVIGEHVKRLKIPIGSVLASPFCRTMETARLAFGKAQPSNEVRGGPVRSDDPSRYAALKKLL